MDGPCQECGIDYPPWWIRHDIWNLVMGGPETKDDPGGLLCLNCFTLIATKRFGVSLWNLKNIGMEQYGC